SIYADDLDSFISGTNEALNFYNNNVAASSSFVTANWNVAYNQIYAANLIYEMAGRSNALPQASKDQFRGEALFFRAINQFYLTQLFGDVPYITGTDYTQNNRAARMAGGEVMANVIADLEQ